MNEQENNDIRVFADNMKIQLENNEWKDGWEECETSFLVEQLRNKMHTVNCLCDITIVKALDKYPDLKTTIEFLQKTLADLSNYAMMVSSNMGRTLK